ncbi:MAG TPA: UDP-N-acetylmuramate--L-alanine ligase [Trebonia sp.]
MGLVTPTEPVPLGELGRIHFAGIGGAGMSGIARIMLARGIPVSGSDSAQSEALSALGSLGARVYVGHSADHLGDADTLVVSSAIRDDNPELAEARRRGLRVLHRAGALASLMFGRRVIAVTGTHGKTTTTSMITTVLRDVDADPGYVIGGVLAATGVGAADGAGHDFVAEADESDGSFLMLSPDAAVITNIEADHLDNYGTAEAYRASFRAFAARIKPGGLLLTCADDPGTRELVRQARDLELRTRSYGESGDADYRLTQTRQHGMETVFSVTATTSPFGEIHTNISVGVPGRHNALNAAAAFAAAVELGVAPRSAAAALGRYRGAARRMEPKGEAGGVLVLDTYAHHPTELAADLRAAREIADGGRVIAVFQPHLYSRTRIFASDFGAALGLADEAVVLDVYAAREDPEPGVSGKLVADAVPGGARYVTPDAEVPRVVASIAAPGDLVLTMGAGDVTRLGPLVLEEISASPEAARS